MLVSISVLRPNAPAPPGPDNSTPTGVAVNITSLKPSTTVKVLVNGTQMLSQALDSSGNFSQTFTWASIPVAFKNLLNVTAKVGGATWNYPDPGAGVICFYETNTVRVELSY